MTTYNIVEFNESEHVHSVGIVPNREEAIARADDHARETGHHVVVIECPPYGLHEVIHSTHTTA